MKRKVKKKNEKLYNKQTSTNDRTPEKNTTIKLFQKKKTNNINTNNFIQQTNNINNNTTNNNNFMSTLENKIKRTESEEKLLKVLKESENLKSILNEKKEELENNKKKYTNEILILNNNIKEQSKQLEVSSNKSKSILNKLNQLNLKINEEYQRIKLAEAVNKLQEDKNNNIKNKNKINTSKKLILLNQSIIDKFKIHKEKLEKIAEKDNSKKLNNLEKELDEMKNKEKEIKSEVEKMRLIKENHEKKCIKIIKDLEQNLERIKNEFNNEHKIKEINKEPPLKKQFYLTNKKFNSLPNIYNNIRIPNDENENEKTILHQRIFKKKPIKIEKTIEKDFQELQEQIKNRIKIKREQDTKNYIFSRNDKKEIEKNNLFSQEEQNILKDVIPMECLNIYQKKYKTITDENNQLIQILQKNESRKKLNEEKNQYIFLNDKKEHNIQKKNVELNSKILLTTKNIKKINKEISEIQKELDKVNNTYNINKNDNEKLRKIWISLNKDIMNKKIILKQGENITDEELNYINTFGKFEETKTERKKSEEKSDKTENSLINKNIT